MSKGGTNYSNYDDHSYHYSSTSKRDNESRYLCNKYKIAGETTQWGTRRESLNLGVTTPGERCPGTLIVQHEIGIAKCDHPYLKVEHKCVDNLLEPWQLLAGLLIIVLNLSAFCQTLTAAITSQNRGLKRYCGIFAKLRIVIRIYGKI